MSVKAATLDFGVGRKVYRLDERTCHTHRSSRLSMAQPREQSKQSVNNLLPNTRKQQDRSMAHARVLYQAFHACLADRQEAKFP